MFRRPSVLVLFLMLALGLVADAAALSPSTLAPADAYGTLPGDFTVTGNGAARFSIPLSTPPGIGGVQPALSLTYSSQEPNGLLGVGFVLEGLSSIARCKAIQALDGYNGQINFDGDDRFCLDGQRLVLTDSRAVYGASGTVYHTIKESWTRLVADGHCGSGPCSFIATTKAGWTLVYEGQIRTASGDMIAWQLTSVTDLNGNAMTVQYMPDQEYHQSLPYSVQYTANSAAGVSPLMSLTFVYEDRPDALPSYAGGQLFATRLRLSQILVQAGNTQVATWQLIYDTSDASGRSRLTAVQLYAPNGTVTPGLVYQTRFAWTGTTTSLKPAGTTASGTMGTGICGNSGDEPTWSDFNGDGLPDLTCQTSDGNASVSISNGTSLARPKTVGMSSWCPTTSRNASGWIDFNGDLLMDLACSGSDGVQKILLSTGSALVPSSGSSGQVKTQWCVAADQCAATYGNFSNDGRADLLCSCGTGTGSASPSYLALLSTGNAVQSPNGTGDGQVLPNAVANVQYCTAAGSYPFWADFNGDGAQDLFCFAGSSGIQVMVSTGSELHSPNATATGSVSGAWCTASGDHLDAADINADGNTDLHCRNDDGTHRIQLSTGSGLAFPENTNDNGVVLKNWCTGADAKTDWGDYNGDGLPDLLCSQGGVQSVMLTRGTRATISFSAASSLNGGQVKSGWCTAADAKVQFTDINGDAMQDITCAQTDGTQLGQIQASPLPDLLGTVTNGIGGTTAITYAPLTDANVYTPGTEQGSWPNIAMETPLYVVSGYTYSDGSSWSSAFRQSYTNMIFDVGHGVLLGFKTMTSLELSTGRKTVTTYDQTYPAQGYILSVTVHGSDGAPLTGFRQTPQVVANNNAPPYQILTVSQTQETYSGGAVVASIQKNLTYDAYGNVTLLVDLGDPTRSDQPVYSCSKFINDTAAWRLGYIQQNKVTNSQDGCSQFLFTDNPVWNGATDLRWQSWSYSSAMQVLTHAGWDDAHSAWVSTSATYDKLGRMSTSTDLAGNTSTFGYSYADLLQTVTVTTPSTVNAGALTVSDVRDVRFGTTVLTTDANGNQFQIVLDAVGRPVQSWGPDPDVGGVAAVQLASTSFSQSAAGFCTTTRSRPAWTSDNTADWVWGTSCVDGLSRPATSQQGGPGVQTVEQWQNYDGAGLVRTRSIPRYTDAAVTYSTTTAYDERNRPLKMVLADGTPIDWTYVDGGTSAMTVTATIAGATADARYITNAYDVRGNLIQTTFANGGVASYQLDLLQQVVYSVGPVGNTTTTSYNSLGQPLTIVDSDQGTTVLTYDRAARRQTSTDGSGNVITVNYDSLNRVTQRVASRTGAQTITTVFQYDQSDAKNGKGALTRVSRPDSLESFGYSPYGLVTDEAVSLLDAGGNALYGSPYSFTNSYDPQSRPVGLTYPDGGRSVTGYDGHGNLLTVDLQEAGAASLTNYATYTDYTALGQPGSVTLKNGLVNDFTYYPGNQQNGSLKTAILTKPGATDGTSPLLSLGFSRNAAGQIAAVTQARPGPVSLTAAYAYQTTGWLQQVTGSGATAGFGYDLAGNVSLKDGIVYSYTPKTNQIASGSNGSAFGYGGNGALASWTQPSGLRCFTYSTEANLQSVLTGAAGAGCGDGLSTVMAASYDADGRRLTRTDPDGTVSLYLSADYEERHTGDQVYKTKYLEGVDGRIVSITSQSTVAAAQGGQSAAGVVTPAGGLTLLLGLAAMLVGHSRFTTPFTRRHRWLARLVPVVVLSLLLGNVPLQVRADLGAGGGYPVPVELYFHRDQVGSTVLTTDAAGAASARVGYQSFGAVDDTVSSGPDTFRQKFSAKELDEATGLVYFGARYYSPALGRFIEPDPAGQFDSPYLYVANDPQTLVDPDGRFVFLLIIAIGAIAGAYFGGEAVNHKYNPAAWNWKKGRTYAGIFAGAAIGAAGAAVGAEAAEAGYASGVIGAGAAENVGFGLLGGDSPQQLVADAAIGGATAGLFEGAGTLLGRLGSRMAQRSASELDVEAEGAAAAAVAGEKEGGNGGCSIGLMSVPPDDGMLEEMSPVRRISLRHFAALAADPWGGAPVTDAGLPPLLLPLSAQAVSAEDSPFELAVRVGACTLTPIRKKSAGRAAKIQPKYLLTLDAQIYPESAAHIRSAQRTHPQDLTIDRAGAKANRRMSLKGIKTRAGLQRDEYPPAMFREGGAGASVRLINPADNMGAGSSFGNALRNLPDGTAIRFKVIN